MKKVIKKAQAGTAIDKTATKKPKGTIVLKNKPKGTYMDVFKDANTKKDSADYKRGYDYGVEKPKNTLQGIFENPRWSAGNLEGREDKRPMKKIKLKNGGSLTGLKASNKRVGSVDPKGAFTAVQNKTLSGAKGKASLTKDKPLGATKMAKCGAKMSKKK